MLIFILEDSHSRMIKFKRELIGHNIHHASTVDEGMSMISLNKYNVILLDHDLGGEELVDSQHANTGYQLAKFIASTRKNSSTPCIIHSCNPAGADNIQQILKHAIKSPFPSLDIGAIEEWVKTCQ